MNFSIDDVYILFGLSAISGIGEKIAKVILEDRDENGKFIGFENFCKRINPSKSQVIQLIKAGAIPTKNKRKTLIQYLKSISQQHSSQLQKHRVTNSYLLNGILTLNITV